jgi:hypothetical protein
MSGPPPSLRTYERMTRNFVTTLLVAFCTAAVIASPAMAGHAAPPGNSGQQQYTESLPEAGGTRPTREFSGGGHHGSPGSGSGGGAGQSGTGGGTPPSPTEAFGAAKAHRFAKAGPDGQAAARLAAAGAATPKKAAADVGAGAGSSSRIGQVVGQLTGTESSQGMGLLLPLIIVGTFALAVGFAVARRRPTRTRS